MRIAVSGASGLVGSALLKSLNSGGHSTVRMVRPESGGASADSQTAGDQSGNADESLPWSPYKGLLEPQRLLGVDAIIHLAGRSIASKRWSPAEKARIRDSRVAATERLVEQIVALESPPPAFISASAIGIYGDRGDERINESSSLADNFLAKVALDWEQASSPLVAKGVRLVHARLGIVLSRHGGALGTVLPIFRMGLGGPVGNGRQYWSWISLDDAVAALRRLVEDPSLAGTYNLVAPEPVTNREFTKELGKAVHRPALIPAPAWLLRTAMGEMADGLLLASCRVEPKRLLEAGFEFQHPRLADCLAKELG